MQRLLFQRKDTISQFSNLQEYILVAYPDTALKAKLQAEQHAFYEQYGINKSDKNSFITIASFSAQQAVEETLVRWLQRVCSNAASFNVTLNNYSGFPPGKVFLRIFDQQPFKKLASELKVIDDFVQSNGYPPARLFTNANLPIADSLPEAIYQHALSDYSKKSFHESFTVSQLVLLRRANNYEERKAVSVFPLKAGISDLYN